MSDLTIKKTNALIAALIVAYYFPGFQLFAAALVTLFVYLLSTRRLNKANIRSAGIPALLAIFLITLLSSVTLSPYPFSLWNTSKDVYFFIAPILMLTAGLLVLKTGANFAGVFKTAINILTITNIVLFSDFFFGGGILDVSLDSRYAYNMDSTASTLALLLIISNRPSFSSVMRSPSFVGLLILNFLLVIASLSRVNIGITLISLIFIYSQSGWLRGGVVVAVVLVALEPLLQIFPDIQSNDYGNHTFFDKVLGSFQEFRISDYYEFAEINENWRGYEAYLGIQQIENVGNLARLIGVGFGSFATGPFDGKLEVIPFFHNGFVTIYLKAGILGLVFFALFITMQYWFTLLAFQRARLTANPHILQAALVIFLLTNSMLLKTVAAHGVYYSKTLLELFFIGIAICYVRHEQRVSPNARHSGSVGNNMVGRKGMIE